MGVDHHLQGDLRPMGSRGLVSADCQEPTPKSLAGGPRLYDAKHGRLSLALHRKVCLSSVTIGRKVSGSEPIQADSVEQGSRIPPSGPTRPEVFLNLRNGKSNSPF